MVPPYIQSTVHTWFFVSPSLLLPALRLELVHICN